MGEHKIEFGGDAARQRVFVRRVLRDVQALAQMLESGAIDDRVTRIGAEQELMLVDRWLRPSRLGPELLAAVDDPHFTSEIARFNLEINLDPVEAGPEALGQLESELRRLIGHLCEIAEPMGVRPLLTGILPTLDRDDLGLENMTPLPRYAALNQAVKALRGRDFRCHIKGRDELTIRHDSVMLESCNTSFQVHLQVTPEGFASRYNAAQLASAPLVAIAANSPLLFGRRLWQETRIALFRQAVDTRAAHSAWRHQSPRVGFGENWVEDSILEVFREDVARFRTILSIEPDQDPIELLESGEIPKLSALRLHSGTVWRWNRACYGTHQGRPHLRIENRVLPSGPTIVDEVANAALWLGLTEGIAHHWPDLPRRLDFGVARENFVTAARQGLAAQLRWLDGRLHPTLELFQGELLGLAREGLQRLGLEPGAERYLEVIEERVRRQRNGASWILESLDASIGRDSRSAQKMSRLVGAMLKRQFAGEPVARWSLARPPGPDRLHVGLTVGDYMSTDLFTVQPDDTIDLAAAMMEWRHIRHVPVEDEGHRLLGIITHRSLLQMLSRPDSVTDVAVHELMQSSPPTTTPDASITVALDLMRRHRVPCLPVLDAERLVGILTERDFIPLAAELLERCLQEGEEPTPEAEGTEG